MQDLKEKNDKLKKEKESYARCDPKRFAQLKKEVLKAKEGANRWTDNIYAVAQYIKKARPEFGDAELESAFPIFKSLDYLE